MRTRAASDAGYGAIGGAASAAFSPDFIKAIDPTGAALDPGQQAALAGFATLLGGVSAGLAGQNAQGGALAGQNEALNNSGEHAADAAKNGGLLSAFGSWLQNTYGDPLGSPQNWGNQFAGLVTGNNGQTSPSDPNNQITGSNNGNPPNTGAAPVAPPTLVCVPGAGCVVTPPLVLPGSPSNAPGNAILSSGNGSGSSDSGDSTTVTRPTPRGSENDVGADLGPGYTPQVSYLNGEQVPYGTAGSVRPDFVSVDGTASFEVKNYNIATNSSGLINNVAQQAIQRADNLPAGMQQQIIIDVRRQTVTVQQQIAIQQGIVQKSNGIISASSIRFKTQ